MKKIVCLVQKNMFSNKELKKLDDGFKAIYKKNYSQESVNVFWMIMPKGYAYSERKLSKATIIMVEVNEDIQKEKREELMRLFSQFLLKSFHVSPLDSLITVANSSFVKQFLEAQQNRIHPLYRPWINLKTRTTVIASKLTNGYYRLRVKM